MQFIVTIMFSTILFSNNYAIESLALHCHRIDISNEHTVQDDISKQQLAKWVVVVAFRLHMRLRTTTWFPFDAHARGNYHLPCVTMQVHDVSASNLVKNLSIPSATVEHPLTPSYPNRAGAGPRSVSQNLAHVPNSPNSRQVLIDNHWTYRP